MILLLHELCGNNNVYLLLHLLVSAYGFYHLGIATNASVCDNENIEKELLPFLLVLRRVISVL